ncbi:SDR family NAD(P)-dependent oxidoreductase [Vibrio alginolyticus]|uniref:SDR family oxidoreductase n=1 Tax=Vibrio TaxID=662 RepID=UPI00215D548E|nr:MULTISPECIES: SDR family NAD(P)-dependent oxidoreductase [Vibrio]MCR9593120.1 SDR family NAD(P)-dependent oxidoreductase [Vibrio alginolyticus]MDW1762629.1 SDR family NAD(P)-dependent oxidoreductase [Vibrio sp. Vb2135]
MKKICIIGNGDIAKALSESLSNKFEILLPNRFELDVTEAMSVETYFNHNRNIDVIVNLAGTLYSSTIIDSNVESWINDINVNLIGTYLTSRMAIIKNSDVRIINISSTAAYNSYNDWSSYCASKAGVLKVSNALALDGYDVITLCPGAIDTKLRLGLNIDNPNVMTIEESLNPIIKAINGDYDSGDIVFYRKDEHKIIREI